MAGYNYTKRSGHSLHGWLQFPSKKCSLSAWLVTITLKEVFTLFMTGYNYSKRSVHSVHDGYNYTKRSVHSLDGWLQLH